MRIFDRFKKRNNVVNTTHKRNLGISNPTVHSQPVTNINKSSKLQNSTNSSLKPKYVPKNEDLTGVLGISDNTGKDFSKLESKIIVTDSGQKIEEVKIKLNNELFLVADKLKSHPKIIVLNFKYMPKVQRQNAVSFLGGAAYALNAKFKKIESNVYEFAF